MKKAAKKSPWIGCLLYIALIGPAYVLTSWQVATSIAVLITALMMMIGGIQHEIKKMKKLKSTPRSAISNTPPHGYVKLVAKIKPALENLNSYITNEPVDYRWISLQRAYTIHKSEADGGSRSESGWSSFYDDETNLKTLEIYDGTGSCLVGLHHAHYHINQKVQHMNAVQLLKFIKAKGLKNVPLEDIEENQKMKVVERWVRKNQAVNFYGTMNKLSPEEVPHDLIKEAKRALKYGADDDTRKRDRDRLLHEQDWQTLLNIAKKDGADSLRILTADYTNTAENELVLNVKDNKALTQSSYIAIVVYLIGAGILSLTWYGFVNSQFPAFFEQF